jgi:group I intron endonuclease
MSSDNTIYSIYCFTNKINQKKYIGFSKRAEDRFKQHLGCVRSPKYPLHRAIAKYGIENFGWEIVYQSKDGAHTKDVMETYFILESNTLLPNGYNQKLGGDGMLEPTQELREKLSRSRKLHVHTEESNNKRSATLMGHQQTEDTKAKLSKASCLYHYIATAPDGKVFEFDNLSKFCSLHNLNAEYMAKVARGLQKNHKKWTIERYPINNT